MSWTSTKIRVVSKRGESWTFDIHLNKDSEVSDSSGHGVARLSRMAVRALAAPDQPAADRARWIMETFNLVINNETRREVEPDVLERAISVLTVKLNFLDASILEAG
jgi:hypothetical protein